MPSSYSDRFCIDSAVFDEHALKLLIDAMGAERVSLGSDDSFPLGEERIGALVESSNLSLQTKLAVLGWE